MTGTFPYLLYRLLQVAAFPFLLLYLGLRMARNRHYARHLSERFGFWRLTSDATAHDRVWLHAVSVGEILSAVPLIKELRGRSSDLQVWVSTTTLAGRALADQRLQGLADGVFYSPLDFVWMVRRILRLLRPNVVVVMETEIWPNLYREARRSGARLVVVNGRISDKTIATYRKHRWFFAPVLQQADRVLAQGSIAQERYRELGFPRVEMAGNLKYDFDPEGLKIADAVQSFMDQVHPSQVWVAASTMPAAEAGDPDEDDVIISAFRKLAGSHESLLLLLAPRRPERFDVAAQKLEAAGIRFVRRSRLTERDIPELPAVLLLDTIGELAGLFVRADVVFMGGTFPQRGGHNPLEPAAFGVPILAGPHMENFAEIADEMTATGGLLRVETPDQLAEAVASLLDNSELKGKAGAAAITYANSRRGATKKAGAAIAALWDESLPSPVATLWKRVLFMPLAWLWRAGVSVDRWRKRRRRVQLGQPVISVGNLAMGGTGKTPMVRWLCARLVARGKKPAVLTRGFGRTNKEAVILKPGELVKAALVGEEAFLIASDGNAAVGIGRDRARVAERLPGDLFVLDDGFQHWPLRRDVDLVMIDAVDPFRGGPFPLGLLREEFDALGRADIVVLHRTLKGRSYSGLRKVIEAHASGKPIFTCRLVADESTPLPESVLAFCGLGNPDAFAGTLRSLGVNVSKLVSFPDHHRYSPTELQQLGGEGLPLVTTEKDSINVGEELLARYRIQVVRVRLEVDEGERLLELCL